MDEITDPFSNFNSATLDVWMDRLHHPTLYRVSDYLTMVVLKLNHINKIGPLWLYWWQ